jgi:putative aldouronate transport system permease protein
MRIKMSFKQEDFGFNLAVTIILTVLFLSVAYPLYFIIIASFSDPVLVGSGQVLLFPKRITLAAYRKVMDYGSIWTGYRNTIFYTVSFTVLSLFMTMTAGYALSRKNVPGKGIIMGYMTFTMFFNGGLIPTYLLMRNIHLDGNPLIIILMGCVNVYNIIIARTFMQSNIPDELFEAATIDGCDHFRFFRTMVIPLSPALIAVMVLFAAVGMWNSWFNAMIYLRKQAQMPLQLVLRDIIVSAEAFLREMQMDSMGDNVAQMALLAESMKYAVIIVSTFPVMCLYPFIQKYFIRGVMIGSIKG